MRGDFPNNILNYFLVKDPKFARFYILPQIHKRLHNVYERLQPKTQKKGSFRKDTNQFLWKIKNLYHFLEEVNDGALHY